jgi:glycosyltransferase involved in cell wall biosynthesis
VAGNGRPYLLDVTRLVWRQWVGRLPTGIDRVCLAYLDRYRCEAQAVVQWPGYRRILSETSSDRLFSILTDSGSAIRRDLIQFFSREQLRVGKRLSGAGRLYFNVGHTALENDGYLRWTRAANVRPVYMVHDLIPITHPEYCRAGEAGRHVGRVSNMLASAVGIIGNSRSTLESLASFASTQGIPVPATIAAPLGTDLNDARHLFTRPPDRPTFVMLGTIEARKNHLLLLQIWARLVRASGSNVPRLLIIGQRGWECEQVFDILDRSEVLRGAVEEVGACSDADLNRHLLGARALLFPTLVEGFGLPLIEALASGTPVIASDLPVFQEIGQGVPDFIDPLDGLAWQSAVEDYAKSDSALRAAQVTRLAGFSPPRWHDHFASIESWSKAL